MRLFPAPCRPFCSIISSTRAFSTTFHRYSSVKLAYDHHPSASSPQRGPLIVLHGLYGSKQNWRSMAKRMSQRCSADVYTLDLRNHGESPATPREVTYTAYAKDVGAFIDSRSLADVTLIGHSMGGKVAMSLALMPHPSLARLVSVDIAPTRGPTSAVFASYIDAMRKVDAAGVKSKKEADEILQEYERDLSVRQFLLTNLKTSPQNSKTYSFRLPLDVLAEQLQSNEIGDFPYDVGEKSWEGPVLFVKGAQSKYINRKSIDAAKSYFPRYKLKTLEAGHWVHAEKPIEFIELVADFVEGKE